MKKLLLPLVALSLLVAGCAPDLTDELNALKEDVAALHEQVNDLQGQIDAVKKLAEAASNNESITDYKPIKDNDGNVIGYTIYFTNMDPIEIYYGKDGKDGQDGKDGENGKDGKDGAPGQDGTDGDSYLVDLIDNGDTVTLVFADGTKITLPKDGEPRVATGTGYIHSLFGIQPTVENPQGFDKAYNTTMAAVGDYLILSNGNDVTKMPVYNRFTGEYLPSVSVNTTGMESGNYYAITTDDGGHLVAASFVSNISGQETENQNVYIYVWRNGIDQAPANICWANIGGGAWTNAPRGINGVNNYELFRTITVCGDLNTEKSIIATASKNAPRPVFLEAAAGGECSYPAFVQWPSGAGITISMWNATKVKILSKDRENLEYFWSSANFRSAIVYAKGGAGIQFNLPTHNWWLGSGQYDHRSGGLDCIDFNGSRLLAVASGVHQFTENDVQQLAFRCYVADVTTAPTITSLSDGFIFDTREGKTDYAYTVEGAGYGIAGMTSPYPFGDGTIVRNYNEMNDVIFAKGKDGHSVQLYMLTAGQGLIGWEITDIDK